MAEVEFSMGNAMACICGTCPVQAESACVVEKNAGLAVHMESAGYSTPSADEVPGLYCAGGEAACDDLDLTRQCACAGCPVFAENHLGQWKYCERGSAAAIG